MKDCKDKNAWTDGSCCCNCAYQLKLFKHPFNRIIGQGNISEQMGYVCTAFDDIDSEGASIFFENKHGMCELHLPKIANQ